MSLHSSAIRFRVMCLTYSNNIGAAAPWPKGKLTPIGAVTKKRVDGTFCQTAPIGSFRRRAVHVPVVVLPPRSPSQAVPNLQVPRVPLPRKGHAVLVLSVPLPVGRLPREDQAVLVPSVSLPAGRPPREDGTMLVPPVPLHAVPLPVGQLREDRAVLVPPVLLFLWANLLEDQAVLVPPASLPVNNLLAKTPSEPSHSSSAMPSEPSHPPSFGTLTQHANVIITVWGYAMTAAPPDVEYVIIARCFHDPATMAVPRADQG